MCFLWLCIFRKGIIIDDLISWHKRIILLFLIFVMGSGWPNGPAIRGGSAAPVGFVLTTCECRRRPRCAFFSHSGGLTCKNKFDARRVDQWLAIWMNTMIKSDIVILWCGPSLVAAAVGAYRLICAHEWVVQLFRWTLKRNAPSLLATRAETRLTVYRAPQVSGLDPSFFKISQNPTIRLE